MAINQHKLDALLERSVNDFGGAWHSGLAVVGDRLGLYRALASDGPLTSAELAFRTETAERYVREWLRAEAAGGYVEYDPATDGYFLTEEQAMVLVDENSPAFLIGAFEGAVAGIKITERLAEAFRDGSGIGWHEHDSGLFRATERLFRPSYAAHLVQEWIPALDGVEARLREGAQVADIGCGHGSSTILMAQAFPNSRFVGFDYHEPSVHEARLRAEQAGLAGRVRFEVASAQTFPGEGYDLVTFFDSLHDMGDPVGAAARVRESLADDGAWLIVEPFAADNVAANLNPVGRAYYAVSTMVCTPASLSQDGARGLGAQAGPAAIEAVVREGGFRSFRQAASTPFNLVLEARP